MTIQGDKRQRKETNDNQKVREIREARKRGKEKKRERGKEGKRKRGKEGKGQRGEVKQRSRKHGEQRARKKEHRLESIVERGHRVRRDDLLSSLRLLDRIVNIDYTVVVSAGTSRTYLQTANCCT